MQEIPKIQTNIRDSLDVERLIPGNKKSLTLPPDEVFIPLNERDISLAERRKHIGMKITQFTSYLLSPTTGLKLDGVCRPDAPKAEKELFDAYAKTCDSVVGKILEWVNLKNLKEFWLSEDGKLTMYFTDNPDEKPTIRDISVIWNWVIKDNFPLYLPASEYLSELRRISSRMQDESRRSQEQLKENLESESFMWGIVEFFYESTPAQAVHTLTPAAILWGIGVNTLWHAGKNTIKIIKKITFRDSAWNIHLIDSIAHPIQWSKDWMRKNFLQILEKFDLHYDPKWRWFYNPEWYTLSKVKDMVWKMTYEEYKKIAWENAVSEKEWKNAKERMSAWNVSDLYASLTKEKTFSDKVKIFLKSNSLELVFYPLAFEHFRRNQTDLNIIRWISGFTAAIAWVKIGKKLPGWMVPKFVFWALAWAGMMIYSDSQMTASVNKWKYFFGKDAGEYTGHEKTLRWQIASSLGLNEMWDLINKYSFPGWREEPVDINILPRVDILRLPKVPLVQSSISVWMNPWDWIRDSAVRDIDDWNEKVPKYTEKLVRDTLELTRAFIKKDIPFSRWSGVWEFKEKFNSLVFSGEGSFFASAREQILEVVLAELGAWTWWKSEWVIMDIIRSRATDFSINPENIGKRKEKLEEKRKKIDEKVKTLIQNIKNPIQKVSPIQPNKQTWTVSDYLSGVKDRFSRSTIGSVFDNNTSVISPVNTITIDTQKGLVASIFERMIKWSEIVSPSTWKGSSKYWWGPQIQIISEDIIIFQSLLENNTKVEWTNMTIASFFATLLDEMAEYTQEHHFLTEIWRGNKKWYNWK